MSTTICSIQFIKEVQQVINENIANTALSGAFVARRLGLSRMHLHRKLRSHCNCSASQFIKECRVIYAKKALRESHYSIQKISIQSGFSSLPYFCKTFREIAGITPTQYRKYHF